MFKKALNFMVFLGAGFGLGWLLGGMLKGKIPIGAGPEWLWSVPVIIFTVLLWHELGHVMGGAIAGFRFHMLAVGPLRIDRRPEGFQMSFNRSPGLWGGVAATAPDPDAPPGLRDLPRRMLIMTAGGPVASILGALAGLAIAWFGGPGPGRLLAGVFGLMSGAIALATMIPQSFGQFKSDGQRVLESWRGGAAAERWSALAALSALATKYRPREWPAEIVLKSTELEDSTYDGVSAVWLRHSWHLDRREHSEAEHWLSKALEKVESWPDAARPLIYANAAYFYSMEAPDAERARRYMDLTGTAGFLPPEGKTLAEAAFACVSGEAAKARELARRGIEMARRHPGSAGEAMREYFALIEARAAQ